MHDLYQEIILEEAKNPQNYGSLTDFDQKIEEKNASCGDEINIFVKIDPSSKIITELKWNGRGCAISRASMSILSSLIVGGTIEDAKKIDKSILLQKLGIEEISPGRLKCLMLGLKAIQKVI